MTPIESSGQNDAAGQWVEIAYIQTTHGLHGELSADILTDFPDRFRPGLEVSLVGATGRRQYRLEEAWFHKSRVILKLTGVDTLTDAELLRGLSVQVPRSERVELPPDRVYISDLIGCAVMESGRNVGTVSGWQETGAVALLKVERAGAGDEILIPFTPEICRSVDVANRMIQVSLPEGLLDLNVPAKRQTPVREET